MAYDSYYADTEIEDLLCELANKVRLVRLMAQLGPERVGWKPEDLLQHAMVNILEGNRSWPKQVQPLAFIRNVARSILSNEAEKRKYELTTQHELIDAQELPATAHVGMMDTPSPLEEKSQDLRIGQCVKSVCELFDQEKDADVLCLIKEKLNSASKKAILMACNLTEKMYGAAFKKLKYRVRKMFPEGLKHWEITL